MVTFLKVFAVLIVSLLSIIGFLAIVAAVSNPYCESNFPDDYDDEPDDEVTDDSSTLS